MASTAELYEQELARWGTQTAALVREGNINAVDLAAVAEELESFGRNSAHCLWHHLRELQLMGGSERGALAHRLIVLLIHLLQRQWASHGKRK